MLISFNLFDIFEGLTRIRVANFHAFTFALKPRSNASKRVNSRAPTTRLDPRGDGGGLSGVSSRVSSATRTMAPVPAALQARFCPTLGPGSAPTLPASRLGDALCGRSERCVQVLLVEKTPLRRTPLKADFQPHLFSCGCQLIFHVEIWDFTRF